MATLNPKPLTINRKNLPHRNHLVHQRRGEDVGDFAVGVRAEFHHVEAHNITIFKHLLQEGEGRVPLQSAGQRGAGGGQD